MNSSGEAQMSNAQDVIELVNTLRQIPEWSLVAVNQALAVQLLRDKKATAKIKRYLGELNRGGLEKVTLTLPIFGGHLGWRVHVKVDPESHILRSDLGDLISPHAKGGVNPAPAPGNKGPAIHSHWWNAPHAQGDATFSFEQCDSSDYYLVSVILDRPHPGNDPDHYDSARFRAYASERGGAMSYVIERTATRTEAVEVPHAKLAQRKLSVSYAAVEPMIGEPLARKLIRQLLIDGLLRSELDGKLDSIAYTALELDTTTTELP
jgi:hypothetical protein